jgi:hypothetical protein
MTSRRGPASGAESTAASGTPGLAGQLSRAERLVVERVGAELLVYDAVADAAHCLSADAARVFEACDGVRDPSALSAVTGLPPEVVARALEALGELGLLYATRATIPAEAGERVRRREALQRLAKASAAAAAAPLIVSAVLKPSAAVAASGVLGQPCTDSMCGAGLTCDPSMVCVPQNCYLVETCAGRDPCGGVAVLLCQNVGYGSGSLCCPP